MSAISLKTARGRLKRPEARARRALVTGGAGFLGSHLCERLVRQGKDVICLDNLQTGSVANLDRLLPLPNFRFVQADVIEPMTFEVDEIFNMACPASPPRYQSNPVHTLKTSVLGALNVLDLARRTGARVLQASTSEVYGDALVHPQQEGYWGNVNSFGPRACYDEGKRAAETLFYDYSRQHGVDIRLVRIFNTYGPRMSPDDGRVVSNFIVQALTNKDITIYGDGTQTRSFCFVDDLMEGIGGLMSSDDPTLRRPVNLGNPAEFSVRELAELVISLTGSPSRIVSRPLPVDDPRQRRPDITLARQALGWAPKVQLIEGVARTIGYFDDLLLHPAAREAAS